ncbi:MAG: L,D-transpeptidase [Bdellovibrio sp.]|nr:L,D-transpeptidase [Bdellovibrio sp.]
MKTLSAITLFCLLLFGKSMASEVPLTDARALELGMTPVTELHQFLMKENKDSDTANDTPDEKKAEVVIIVNKAKEGTASTAQTMRVYVKGDLLYTFPVSTGKETRVRSTSGVEYIATTPLGYFRPASIWKEYQSSQWIGAQMNHPIFFIGGIALHSTTPDHFSAIGRRDSGGCVRLMPENAKILNELVLTTGLDSFEVVAKDNWVDKRRITRNQVVGGEVPVPAINRSSGDLRPEKIIKSWETIIIIKELRD